MKYIVGAYYSLSEGYYYFGLFDDETAAEAFQEKLWNDGIGGVTIDILNTPEQYNTGEEMS